MTEITQWPHLLLAPLGVTLLFAGWLAVQMLWRRVFDVRGEADALDGRCGCAGGCRRREDDCAGADSRPRELCPRPTRGHCGEQCHGT